jgi:hypothetical protein
MRQLPVTANIVPRPPILVTPWWWRRYVPPKHRFLQEPPFVTSQKTAFFIVAAVKTSNLTTIVRFRSNNNNKSYSIQEHTLESNSKCQHVKIEWGSCINYSMKWPFPNLFTKWTLGYRIRLSERDGMKSEGEVEEESVNFLMLPNESRVGLITIGCKIQDSSKSWCNESNNLL